MSSESKNAGPGPFDRFIEDFASKNLESRARSTAFSLLALLAFTGVALGFALTREFSLSWHGSARSEQRNGIVILSLDKGFARFAGSTPEVTCQAEGFPMWEPYRVIRAEETAQALLVTVQSISGVSDTKSTRLSCKAILERKTYWALLTQKSGEDFAVE